MPNLRIIDGGREYLHQIEGDSVTIGRGSDNTIVLQDAKASKEHCRVENSGGRWRLVDLESKNGTRVNGQLCNKAWLEDGDTIRIGAAELRFGGQAARRGPARTPPELHTRDERARTAARSGEAFDEEPPPRRYAPSQSDQLLKWSLVVVGCVLVVGVYLLVAGKTRADPHNDKLLEQVDALLAEGRWEDAIHHLRTYADPSGNKYHVVQQRLNELEERYAAHQKDVLEQEATRLVSKLGLKIKAYNVGKKRITSPEQILGIVELLKTKYAATETTARAAKQWPAWFAGRVPQRAIDRIGTRSELDRDWDAAVQAAREFEKQWHFREAYETIDKFVTTREAILGADVLERYRSLRDEQHRRLDRLAESIYTGRRSLADRLVRQKRYDQAIATYRKVIDTFGIDAYARKAQAEIRRIEQLKAAGS